MEGKRMKKTIVRASVDVDPETGKLTLNFENRLGVAVDFQIVEGVGGRPHQLRILIPTLPPAIYPCGCSQMKVKYGRCSTFDEDGVAREGVELDELGEIDADPIGTEPMS